MTGTGSSPFGWADLIVVPLIVVLSVPPLAWFANHWVVIGNDAARYLLAGSQLISGRGLEDLNSISGFNGGHGPGLPALIGSLILLFGRDTAELVWTVRLLALLNPLSAYFLVKRISSPAAGLIVAALITLFGYNVRSPVAVTIDAPLLTLYLLALLTLLAAIQRDNSSLLALLSGVLLGACILTKETALVNLPLALLAVLLLGWDLRSALFHYLGVALVCLPWWVWAYSASQQVYLIDRLPSSLQVPVLILSAIVLIFVVLAYASGLVGRFLADESRRRWSALIVVIGWIISLSEMLLATASHALSKVSFEDLKLYLGELLAPTIVVIPMVVMAVGYVIYKAVVKQDGGWKLMGLALLFQVPVCLLVIVEGWAWRQFLITQTLLLCALGALVADAGEAALRERGSPGRQIGVVVAAPLTILLIAASVERVQALLSSSGLSEQRGVAPQATEMVDWMAQNTAEGEHILYVSEPAINASQANYLMFLDGGRHEWTKLQLDQGICQPRPNIQIRCDPEKNAVSRTPSDAVWIQRIGGECRFISLSMSNLLKQLDDSRASYVMIAGSPLYPSILQLPSPLQESNAFEVAHADLAQNGALSANQGVVLLESTGRAPEDVPTQMTANTMLSLKRCEQAKIRGARRG